MEAAISCKFHCNRLAEHWQGYWPATDAAELAADIQERLAAATAVWGIQSIEPLDGGVVALTCAAMQNDRPVVLKLNPRGHRDGLSAEARLTELGRLAARLHQAGPPPSSFMHIREFAPDWELPRDGAEEVLAHLDLHGGNALRAGGSWKVIDPKGVRADRHADVWALIDPLMLELLPESHAEAQASAARWIDCYADAARMDPAKTLEWTRIRARAELAESGGWPGLRRMADALG